MTGPLLLGVDVAAILRFLEVWASERAAISTGAITWSSIISPERYRECVYGVATFGRVLGRQSVENLQKICKVEKSESTSRVDSVLTHPNWPAVCNLYM